MVRGVKRPEETRALITRAAAEALAEKGYGGVRVQDVARRAGLTTGAIYAHFPGRAALIAAAVAQGTTGVLAAGLADPAGDPDVAEWLVAIASRVLAEPSGTANPLEIEALVAARREPELARLLVDRVTGLHDLLAQRIVAGQERGELDPSLDPAAVAYLCHALVLGMLLLDPLGARPDAAAWSVLVRGLVAGVTGGGRPSAAS
jgi:AcrR family transcriptional regulator